MMVKPSEAALELPADAGLGRDPLAARRVERLLSRLAPAQRAAVTLYYLEDQPVEAVSAALGMPENTVKTHLHRARAALRAAWRDHGGERWLDGGRPAEEAEAPRAHAAGCARCAAALAAMDAVEAALRADPGVRAPAWLAPAVTRQVRMQPRRALAPAHTFPTRGALTWWTLSGLALGGVGWGMVALLGPAGAPSLPSPAAGAALGAAGTAAALAAVSTVGAAALTWASLKLTRLFQAA
jgi:hypothetical protein